MKDNLDLKAAHELAMGYCLEQLPYNSLPFAKSVVSTDTLVYLLDYVLVSSDNLQQGLNRWCQVFEIFDPQLHSYTSQDKSDWYFKLNSDSILPSWQHSLLVSLQVRLQFFNVPPQASSIQGFGQSKDKRMIKALKPFLRMNSEHSNDVLIKIKTEYLSNAFSDELPNISDALSELMLFLKNNHVCSTLVDRVKHLVQQMLPEVGTIQQVAELLALTPRTLQRRLQESGCTFNEILQDVRHKAALKLLEDSQQNIQEIAHQLGFIEQSSFNHAFKKWQGLAPSKYRKTLGSGSSVSVGKEPEVALHYVESHMQFDSIYRRRGYQVWIQLKNIARDKIVTVAFEYADGIWRDFRATYQCFLREGIELWATPNLIPAKALKFKIHYRVAGESYADDNQGMGYCALDSSSYLKGIDPLVIVDCFAIEISPQNWVLKVKWLTEIEDNISCELIIPSLKSSVIYSNPMKKASNAYVWHAVQALSYKPKTVTLRLLKYKGTAFESKDYPVTVR